MIDKADHDQARFCGIVEDNLVEFVEELRAIDLVDLVSFIRFESFPTVEDLVNSSTELFFKPEMLVFAWAAGVDLRWDAPPVVTLGLEFRHPEVSLFFNLTLRSTGQSVDILGVAFERPPLHPAEMLARAFRQARLQGGRTAKIPQLRKVGPAVRKRAPRIAPKGLPWP